MMKIIFGEVRAGRAFDVPSSCGFAAFAMERDAAKKKWDKTSRPIILFFICILYADFARSCRFCFSLGGDSQEHLPSALNLGMPVYG
jgi:hypothetical protein